MSYTPRNTTMRDQLIASGVIRPGKMKLRRKARKIRLIPFRDLPDYYRFTRFGREFIKLHDHIAVTPDGEDACFALHELVHPVAKYQWDTVEII